MAEIQSGLDTSDSAGIQGDLFGEDDSAMQEIVAISKAAGELVKENKQKIAAVSGAVKRPEIAREMGVDINNPEQVKAAIQALEYENSRLMSPTPEIEILNKIRRRAGLSEIVDESTTDSEVDVHHDDDTASLDLGFDAKKDEEFVPALRSFEFIENLLQGFGDPVSVQRGLFFKDAQSAADTIYNEISKSSPVVNVDTGWNVRISKDEIRKFISLKPKSAWGLLYSLPEIISRAKYDGKRLDKYERSNVVYHRFFAQIGNNGNISPCVLTIREITSENGLKKYYDVSLVDSKKREISSDREAMNAHRDFPEDTSLYPQQSENSSESQEENSDNLNPDSSAKVVAPVSASSTASSTSTTAGATVLTAEEKASRSYAVLRKLASAVFKARKAILSRKIYDGGRILPRGIKLDKTTNRLVGMCSIADIRRYISKAFELPISSGIRDGSKRMLGAYWNSLQAISMKSGHLNDIQSVAHELGHHLEMILFGYTLNGSKTVSTNTLMPGLNSMQIHFQIMIP